MTSPCFTRNCLLQLVYCNLTRLGFGHEKMILGMVLVCFSLAMAAEQITLPIGEQTRSSELSLPGRSMTKKQFRGLSGPE